MTDPVDKSKSASPSPSVDASARSHDESRSATPSDGSWSPPATQLDRLKSEPTQAERLAGTDAQAGGNAATAAALANRQGAQQAAPVARDRAEHANALALEHSVRSEAASRMESQSANVRGPVLTGVGDPQTGGIHYGTNFNLRSAAGRQEYAQFRENAHPLVKSRIEARDAEVRSGAAATGPSDGKVGAHSEVVALDKAIKAREAATGVPVREADLGSFQLHNRSMMNAHPAAPMDRCSNCKSISAGTEVIGHDGAKSATLQEMAASKRPYSALTPQDLPGLRQGGALGAAGSAAVATGASLRDGRISADEARDIAVQTGAGAAIGATSAGAERAVTPAIDRAIAARTGAAAPSALAPSLGARVLGSSAVGAAVSAGVSIYTNRDGLAKGDSKAIGNVTADTAVGVAAVAGGSVLGAAAAGALAGSVVPGLGTAVGFAVGVGVGVAITYGAELSGARQAIADTAAAAVDGVKSLASDALGGLKGMFS